VICSSDLRSIDSRRQFAPRTAQEAGWAAEEGGEAAEVAGWRRGREGGGSGGTGEGMRERRAPDKERASAPAAGDGRERRPRLLCILT
jgi:hypothetical protein